MCRISGTEHCTFEDVANITIYSASATPQKKHGNTEDFHVNNYDKNEVNRSTEVN